MKIGRRLNGQSYTADGPRESFCEECGSRITTGTDGRTEYGHQYGCSRRPESFPANYGSGAYVRRQGGGQA